MNAIRDALVAALKLVSGFVPDKWQGLVLMVSRGLSVANWGDSDERWAKAARLVTNLLTDLEQARALEGVDLSMAARAAAEVRYTRALRDLGLLEVV